MNKLPLILFLLLGLAGPTRAAESQTITVSVTVPDAGWTISIDEVRQVKGELWVLSTLYRPGDVLAAQVISTVTDSVEVASKLSAKHFVRGKKWNWENSEPYTFIGGKDELGAEWKTGKRLHPSGEKK